MATLVQIAFVAAALLALLYTGVRDGDAGAGHDWSRWR